MVCAVHGNQLESWHETRGVRHGPPQPTSFQFNFPRVVTTMNPSRMSCSSLTDWPTTFTRGDFVRLRDTPVRVGVVVQPGEQLDEWLIAFVDGERNVYLFEHVETFVPTSSERTALAAISEP